jgi:hypothetical protein
VSGGYSARATRIASEGQREDGEGKRRPLYYGRGSGGRTEALVA